MIYKNISYSPLLKSTGVERTGTEAYIIVIGMWAIYILATYFFKELYLSKRTMTLTPLASCPKLSPKRRRISYD